MSTELQLQQVKDIRATLTSKAVQDQIALALPKHLTPDRFARVALTAMTKNPKLLDCTRESLLRCLMDCSSLGLEPNGRDAHLIPYKTECTLIIDYKGLIALSRRSGDVAIFKAELVREKDDFSWDTGVVSHQINWREDRGKTEAVYSYVKFKDGSEDWEVMTLAEVEAIRKRSRAGSSGPWASDFDEMAKKTAIRRHSKRLTLSPEFMAALEKDDDRAEERQAKGHVTARREPLNPFDRPELPEPPQQEAPPEEQFTLTTDPPSTKIREWLDSIERNSDDYCDALRHCGISTAKYWRDVSEGEHQTALNRLEEVGQFLEEVRA